MGVGSALLIGTLSGISIALILLLVTAGSHPRVLPSFYFLKIITSGLNFPSALSTSTFLQGLSTLTGSDLIGKPASALSLGLANTYQFAILASCADWSNGTTCTPLQYGHNFDFANGLKLNSKEDLNQALEQYKITALFLGVGYLIAKVLTLLASALAIIFGRRRWGAILASVFSLLASILLIAAAGAAMATFTKLDADLKAAYNSIGLKVELGKNLFILAWSVALFSLGISFILIARIKSSGKIQYIRVGKQGDGVLFDQKRERSMDGDRERLVHGNARESIDGGHGDLGYAHPSGNSIPLKSLHLVPGGQAGTAYGPYREK